MTLPIHIPDASCLDSVPSYPHYSLDIALVRRASGDTDATLRQACIHVTDGRNTANVSTRRWRGS